MHTAFHNWKKVSRCWLEGRSYNRAIRVHKLAYEALMRVAWRGFQPWVDERCPLDMNQIRRALDEVANLGNDLTKDNHDRVIQSQPFKCLNERFEEFVDHLRKTNGPLAAFWMSYIDMVANAAHGKSFNTDMKSLQEDHSEVHEFMKTGGLRLANHGRICLRE